MALGHQSARGGAFAALHLMSPSASVESDGLFYFFPTDDWIIGRSLYMNGGWDEDYLNCAVDLVGRLSAGPAVGGGVVLDVGANIGTTALQLLHRFDVPRVVAVEPSPVCLRYLRANVAANGFSDRCTIVELAVSDVAGSVALQTDADNSGGAQIVGDELLADVVVPSETLDEILLATGVDPGSVSMVWVDVEGHEYRVLKGAGRLLEADVPFFIEFWPRRLRENGDFDLLVDLIVGRMTQIVDVRARVDGTRPAVVEPTRAGMLATSAALGAWPTDLLLIP